MFTAYQCRTEASNGHDADARLEMDIKLAPEFHGNHSMLYFLNSPLACIRVHSIIGPDVGSMQALWGLLSSMEPGTDIAEICGGQGRVLKVSTRRRLRTGRKLTSRAMWTCLHLLLFVADHCGCDKLLEFGGERLLSLLPMRSTHFTKRFSMSE